LKFDHHLSFLTEDLLFADITSLKIAGVKSWYKFCNRSTKRCRRVFWCDCRNDAVFFWLISRGNRSHWL